MCSGRLALDQANRLIVVTTTADPVTEIGHRFLVLDLLAIGVFEPRGRGPTAAEMAQARVPYESSPRRWDKPLEVPDDELDEKAALEAARQEQQRQPFDLFSAAA